MGDLKEALSIDLPTLLVSVLVVVGGLKVIIELIKWFINQFGIEFKSVRKKNEEHDLLYKTDGSFTYSSLSEFKARRRK